MTDKDLLLSKLYDDNTICYWIQGNIFGIKNKRKYWVANCNLNTGYFWLSYNGILKILEERVGGHHHHHKIIDLTSGILEEQLKIKNFIVDVKTDL